MNISLICSKSFQSRCVASCVGAVLSVSYVSYSACSAEIPEPLLNSLTSRAAHKTASIRFELSCIGTTKSWYVQNLDFRFCGESYIVVNFGDQDGIMGLTPDGSPSLGESLSCSPRKELIDQQNGNTWRYMVGSVSAIQANKLDAHEVDPRTIGLEPYPFAPLTPWTIKQSWEQQFPSTKNWNVASIKDTIKVTAEASDGDAKQIWRWKLDHSKADAVIEMTVHVSLKGEEPHLAGKCETEYALIDGNWFPKKAAGWRTGGRDRKLKFEYRLLSASFDRVDHIQNIDVSLLQLPAGTRIGGDHLAEPLIWDGDKSVPRSDWIEFKKATNNREIEELRLKNQKADNYRYPGWWYDDTGRMGIKDLETKPDEWEAYVRRWCLKNGADEKQRAAAKAILEDSRKEARTILAKRAPELDKIEKQLKDGKLDAKKADEARAEGKRLLAPIAEIFNRLKSRLEPLLLQKQISAKQPTSAPARTP